MVDVEIPRALFDALVARGTEKLASNPRNRLVAIREPISVVRLGPEGYRILATDPQTLATPLRGAGELEVLFCRTRTVFNQRLRAIRAGAYGSEGWLAWLVLGTGGQVGLVSGCLKPDGSLTAIAADRVMLTGPGMERLSLGQEGARQAWPASENIWSRSQGAMGREAWERMVTDRFLLVGAGRSGSLFAQALVNLGVRNLVLVDPDEVEPHNLDGGPLFGLESIGRPKAEVLAAELERMGPWATVEWVRSSIGARDGMEALKAADVVISAVDSARSLLMVHALCRVYGRTLVTVGTRIRRDEIGLDVAADVGLYYGGVPGCLLCVGGPIPEFHAIRRDLAELPEPSGHVRRVAREGAFETERAGSLLSLNATAMGIALYRLQSAYGGGAERVQRASLTRLFFDEEGRLRVDSFEAGLSHLQGECLCSMMNTGDAGLELLRAYGNRSRLSFSPRMR